LALNPNAVRALLGELKEKSLKLEISSDLIELSSEKLNALRVNFVFPVASSFVSDGGSKNIVMGDVQ
jgi:hypothetical protein